MAHCDRRLHAVVISPRAITPGLTAPSVEAIGVCLTEPALRNGMVRAVSSVLLATGLATDWWRYLVLFLAVMASWAGVPFIGAAAVGAAAVAASQGQLNLVAVIVVATIAGEVGGLIGYAVGFRWGRQILERPGKRQAGRQKIVERGEQAYEKWGRLAVFVTPAIVSGTAKMHHGQFVLWNFVASLAFALSVA